MMTARCPLMINRLFIVYGDGIYASCLYVAYNVDAPKTIMQLKPLIIPIYRRFL